MVCYGNIFCFIELYFIDFGWLNFVSLLDAMAIATNNEQTLDIHTRSANKSRHPFARKSNGTLPHKATTSKSIFDLPIINHGIHSPGKAMTPKALPAKNQLTNTFIFDLPHGIHLLGRATTHKAYPQRTGIRGDVVPGADSEVVVDANTDMVRHIVPIRIGNGAYN